MIYLIRSLVAFEAGAKIHFFHLVLRENNLRK